MHASACHADLDVLGEELDNTGIHGDFLEGSPDFHGANRAARDEHDVGGADRRVVDVLLLLTNLLLFLLLN